MISTVSGSPSVKRSVVSRARPLQGNVATDGCLAFRDLLRHNADARRNYATEKQRLADRYRSDRQAYTAGKQEIIQTLLRNLAGEYAANIALEPSART